MRVVVAGAGIGGLDMAPGFRTRADRTVCPPPRRQQRRGLSEGSSMLNRLAACAGLVFGVGAAMADSVDLPAGPRQFKILSVESTL